MCGALYDLRAPPPPRERARPEPNADAAAT